MHAVTESTWKLATERSAWYPSKLKEPSFKTPPVEIIFQSGLLQSSMRIFIELVIIVIFFLPVILGTGFILDQILGENLQEQSINVVRELLFSEEVVRSVPAEFLEMVQELLNRISVVLWNCGVQILLFLTGLQK